MTARPELPAADPSLDPWRHAEASARLGVWDLDVPQGRVRYSAQWKALLGYPPVDGEDDTAVWRERVHPDDASGMVAQLREHLEGRSEHYECEFRLRAADGHYRRMLSRGRVIERDADGRALRAIGSMIDLGGTARDERERIEQECAEAVQAARARFLSRMSHDLRTPMNAILGFTQLLDARLGRADRAPDPEEHRRFLRTIEKAGWEMVALIDELLADAQQHPAKGR